MTMDDLKQLAVLLKRAADRTITESEFWKELQAFPEKLNEPVIGIARESATHYWGNFHRRNIFLMRGKPNPGQLEQGKNELNLIAEALGGGWDAATLEERLKNI